MLFFLCVWSLSPVFSLTERAWYSPSTRAVPYTGEPLAADTAIDLCTLPPNPGGCTKHLIRYYYDPDKDDCRRFTFTGCGGNSNRFMRRSHCKNRCVKDKEKSIQRHEILLTKKPGLLDAIHKDAKHRRTLTTTTPSSTSVTTTTTKTTMAPITPKLKMIDKVEISSSIRNCPYCDPLFGKCVDGQCGCIDGFRKLGRICIDINECDSATACPFNSRCVNTIGSFRCDCDEGFAMDGECRISSEACSEPFDISLTEEDCNSGEQQIRYYFDKENSVCKKFFYGGCESESKNNFADLETCDSLCAKDIRTEKKLIEENRIETANQDTTTVPILELSQQQTTTTQYTEEEKKRKLNIITTYTDRCLAEFDEVLRLECMSAFWVEKFYWNSKVQECEPFWYDSTCDPRDVKGKNFFDSLEDCQTTCHEEVDPTEPAKDLNMPATASTEKTTERDHPTTVELKPQSGSTPEDSTVAHSTVTTCRREESNFATKTATTKFDRLKYMEEFKRKLSAFPDDYKRNTSQQLNLKTSKRTLFTLPPSIFASESERKEDERVRYEHDAEKETVDHIVTLKKDTENGTSINNLPTTTISAPTNEVNHVTTPEEVEITPTTKEFQPSTKLPTTTDFFTREKEKVEKTLSQISQVDDLCEEPLHPTLEEDCNNEDWVIRWFFNTDRGACKSFWYGGCESDARNFFPSIGLCNIACGHKMPPEHGSLQPKFMLRPGTSPVRRTTPSVTTTKQPETDVHLFPTEYLAPTPPATEKLGKLEEKEVQSKMQPDHKTTEASKEMQTTDYPETTAAEKTTTKLLEETEPPLSNIETTTFTESSLPPTFSSSSQGMEKGSTFGQRNVDEAPKQTRTTQGVYEKMEEAGEKVTNVSEDSEETEEDNSKKDAVIDVCDSGYDEKWDEDCSGDDWQVRAYYDTAKGGCKRFWWGGCETSNKNIWKDTQDCVTACGHKMETRRPYPPYTTGTTDTQPTPTSTPSVTVTGDIPTLNASQNVPHANLSDTHQFSLSEAKPIDFMIPFKGETTSKSNKVTKKVGFNVRAFAVYTTYKMEKRTSRPRKAMPTQEMQNDAPDSTQNEPNGEEHATETATQPTATATQPTETATEAATPTTETNPKMRAMAFQSDLDRQMGAIKRKEEHREDLEYSSQVNHPVTVASQCLESFDVNLTKSCNGGKEWKNRYYFDRDMRKCRMFWNDGCFSTSKNNFDDKETCEWQCEGTHPEKHGRACLDKFDRTYMEDCRHGEFSNRFYFDHKSKRCVAFHWGGCRSESHNFFTDMTECEELCETPPRQLTQSCIEPFDHSYRDSCAADGRFQQYYFFDHATHTCRMFWYGNCRGAGENIYPSLETCQWICERHREERVPAHCSDRFDSKYTESCGDGKWMERWYFQHNTGECVPFWWDQCTASSQNIFQDEKSCQRHCVHPGYELESRLPDPETNFRCLEQVEVGTCRETYPAFYYDRTTKECRPFAYSGCGGNGNRFNTLSQCQDLCFSFNDLTEPEMDCYQPLHIGYGKNDELCLQHSSYRFYHDRDYGRCSQFWYLGCGGNMNNFYSFDVCQRTCKLERRRLERKPRASSNACFQAAGSSGKCESKVSRPVQRWTYKNGKCIQFTYTGCGGTDNRFATEMDCMNTCRGHKPSANTAICSHQPDWGSCNQLRYMWFYNETRATCDQFLYGGCGGNTNKFESFEVCQEACEVSGLDPCLESLDRGNWCEAMSNRYYFNKRKKKCRGFHYTGCGKSNNNFLTAAECHEKCEKRHSRKRAAPSRKNSKKTKPATGYSGVKPVEKTDMLRHIRLQGDNVTYYKSDAEWIDYAFCVGYRYNVSGRDTVLQVHLCAVNGNGDCQSETIFPTDGEEFCNVFRPFLRGTHLYSWYFQLESKHPPYSGTGESGRIQRKSETIATILQLKPNHCHEIC